MSFKIFFTSGNPITWAIWCNTWSVSGFWFLFFYLTPFWVFLFLSCSTFLSSICFVFAIFLWFFSFLWFLFPLGNLVSHMQSKGLSTQSIRLLDIHWRDVRSRQPGELCMQLSTENNVGGRELKIRKGGVNYITDGTALDGQAEKSIWLGGK